LIAQIFELEDANNCLYGKLYHIIKATFACLLRIEKKLTWNNQSSFVV
jgi:hypothetical protein